MSIEAASYEPTVEARAGTRVLVIDNYDSFTFNLVQYLLELGTPVDVVRNDEYEGQALAEYLRAGGASHLLLSPGPGTPRDSGVCQELCAWVCDDLDVTTLGVCLGHQTLCEVHGASVVRASRIMHGKLSPIEHDGGGVFAGLESPYTATRYHSLIVEESTLPAQLVATAHTPHAPQRELMGVRHVSRPVFGVQFHPESILTDHGHDLLRNFLEVAPGGDG